MKRFYRLSGAGNDFLAFAEPDRLPQPEDTRRLCRRGLSLGADGLFVLQREGDAVGMRHWNADGSDAELCVNGTRCAARLAFHLGWAREEVSLRTAAGVVTAFDRGPTEIEIEIVAPDPGTAVAPADLPPACQPQLLRVGVPHLVLSWDGDLDEAPVTTQGKRWRRHPELGPDGANVNFVRFLPPDKLELRTFERGVEAETLACGSGVLAAVAVGLSERGLRLPVTARTRGGCSIVVAEVEGDPRTPARWRLRGDARLLAEGDLVAGALAAC